MYSLEDPHVPRCCPYLAGWRAGTNGGDRKEVGNEHLHQRNVWKALYRDHFTVHSTAGTDCTVAGPYWLRVEYVLTIQTIEASR